MKMIRRTPFLLGCSLALSGLVQAAFAQCPRIRSTGPRDAVREGEPLTFTAAVTGGDPNQTVTYNWTVSAGTISSGQGTSTITVDTEGIAGQRVRVTVTVGGLDRSCARSSSSTAQVAKPKALEVAEQPGLASPRAWVAKGDTSYSGRDYLGATAAYANAVRLNPKDAETLLKLSVSRNEIGRLPDALAAAEAAIRLNPALAEAYVERAYALKRLGEQQPGATGGKDRFTAAVAAYKEAIRLKPAYGLGHLGLGDVYYDNLDAYAEAVGAYTQALRYFPRDVELRYKLGLSYALLDRQAEAAAQLAEAVRLDGDYYEARAELSAALRKLGRLPEALEQVRAALRVKPDYAGGHARLALVYAAQGNRKGAVEEYRIAERLDKSVLEQLGPALQKLGVSVQPSAAGSPPAPRGACPTLTLEGAYDVFGGQPAEFSAHVSGGNRNVEPAFNWTVSAGTITSGQGTATVNVDTNALQGRPITAYVQLIGLARECDVHSASRTRVLGRDLP